MTDVDLSAEDLGTIEAAAPPRNTRVEMCVLGALMGAAPEAPEVGDVAEILGTEDFYEPKHSTIFGVIVDLSGRGTTPDAYAVAHHLGGELARIGGVAYLAECLEAPTSIASAMHYAEIVAELAKRRRLMEAGAKLQALARQPGPVLEIIQQAQHKVDQATMDRRERSLIESVGDLIDPMLEEVDAVNRGLVKPGIPTGLTDLDKLTGGLKPGQLWIPAGRTSMGKSVATQNWMVNAAMASQRPVILFSVEMSKAEMMKRLIAQQARVPLHLINEGGLDDRDWERINEAKQTIYGMPLYVVDTVRNTPAIRAYCRRFRQVHGDLATIGVDYLQDLEPVPGKRRPERVLEVGEWARDLKTLGQDMAMPVVAPCQLNRGPETRMTKDGKIPKLADLRESGNLEQTADVAVLIYRPGYYDRNDPRAGEADMIVAKNRNGATDTITVADQMHLMRFVDQRILPQRWPNEPPKPGPWD